MYWRTKHFKSEIVMQGDGDLIMYDIVEHNQALANMTLVMSAPLNGTYHIRDTICTACDWKTFIHSRPKRWMNAKKC